MTTLKRIRHLPSAALLALVGIMLAACAPAQPQAPADTAAVVVRVAPATLEDISVSSVYVASIEARDQVDLSPMVSGRIERLNVDLGSPVRQGQVIALLSNGAQEAEVRRAQAELINAEARLASLEARIGPDRVNAQSQLDAARARLERLLSPTARDLQAAAGAVDRAQAELESARTELRRLENPTQAELASARAAVANAEGVLSRAQVAVNQAIADRLVAVENPVSSQIRRWWEMILTSRLHQQAKMSSIQNLQEAYGLELPAEEVDAARRIIEQSRVTIAALIELIEANSVIPQEISRAMWEEASAQAALEDARANLRQLESPDPNTVALAQHRVAAAQGSLDAAAAELALLEDPTPAAIATAMAEVAQAEQTLALTLDDQVAYDLTAAGVEVERARAGVDLANQQLADTRILAPFDGTVTRKWLSAGALASPQTPVVTLSGPEIVVTTQIEETAVNWVSVGQPVTLRSPALPGQRLEMIVDSIASGGDRRDHTFIVKFRPVELAPELRAGMSGQVMVETRREQLVLVPEQTVVYPGDQPAVFVVRNGRAYLQEVTLGVARAGKLEITSGVQAGDQVVVSGQERLQDGDPVRVEITG